MPAAMRRSSVPVESACASARAHWQTGSRRLARRSGLHGGSSHRKKRSTACRLPQSRRWRKRSGWQTRSAPAGVPRRAAGERRRQSRLRPARKAPVPRAAPLQPVLQPQTCACRPRSSSAGSPSGWQATALRSSDRPGGRHGTACRAQRIQGKLTWGEAGRSSLPGRQKVKGTALRGTAPHSIQI